MMGLQAFEEFLCLFSYFKRGGGMDRVSLEHLTNVIAFQFGLDNGFYFSAYVGP